MTTRLRMAVIGVGHLGKEHARILAGLPEAELVGVADVNFAQAQAVAERFGTLAFEDFWPLLNFADAAIIVVPTVHHGAVAAEFLKRSIPLLVEKPFTINLHEADALLNIAEKNKTFVQVGHIERFNPAFQEIRRRPLSPKFIRGERLGTFTGRSCDIGVVLDLMIHEIDMVLTLVHSPVERVEALGISVFGQHEDMANARLYFADGCVAELIASRANPTASRHMLIWAPEGFALLDFAQKKATLMQPSSEVREHGLDPLKLDPSRRAALKDELFSRHLQTVSASGQGQDQLTAELKEFIHCVQTGATPQVGGKEGREAIALAERILGAMRLHRWTGSEPSRFVGPTNLPPPLGVLFTPDALKEVA